MESHVVASGRSERTLSGTLAIAGLMQSFVSRLLETATSAYGLLAATLLMGTKKAWQVCVYPSGLLVQGMRRMIRNKPNITLMATLYYLFLSFYATDRIVKILVTVVSFWEEGASHPI